MRTRQSFDIQILHGNQAVPIQQPVDNMVVERGALVS